MTTDRELLELAARAAGIEIHEMCDSGCCIDISPGAPVYWNPLESDSDALRLAVKLCMRVDAGYVGCADVYGTLGSLECVTEALGDDPYAATRRAIVRAAAEIGKGMA